MVEITYKTLTGEVLTGYIRTDNAANILFGVEEFVQVFGDEEKTKPGSYIRVDSIGEIYY